MRSDTRPVREDGTVPFSRRRQPISKASDVQREKVDRIGICAVCGKYDHPDDPLEPAHLWARARGGCDDELCCVPLCHWDHRALDGHKLDLLPHLIPRYAPEIAHMVEHANGDLIACLERLTGGKVEIHEPGDGGA